jgi:hypothetical protein
MEHLENHPHATVKNTIVTGVFAFENHDPELLNQIKLNFDADEVVCCCDNGIAYKGGTWVNGQFRTIPVLDYFIWDGSTWVPPVPKPEGDNVFWNDDTRSWVVVESP